MPSPAVRFSQLSLQLALDLKDGSVGGVRRALEAGASPNCPFAGEAPPLIGAAHAGDVAIVKLLIDRGADLEAVFVSDLSDQRFPCWQGARALHAAIRGSRADTLRVLLDADANPNSTTWCGATPLMTVCTRAVPPGARQEMAELLLASGGDPLLADETFGTLPTHCAADSGTTVLLDKLLSIAPMTLNITMNSGASSLAIAAARGHAETVSFLLSAGASDAWDANGVHALREAVRSGRENVVQILLDEGLEAVGGLRAIPDALLFSIVGAHVGILRRLLNVQGVQEAWANVHVQATREDVYGLQPILHVAAGCCSHRAAHVLLSAGADESAVNGGGERASDVIGAFERGSSGKGAKEAALRRILILERGPAFRARSWTWQTQAKASVTIASEVTLPNSGTVRVWALGVRMLRRKAHNVVFTGLTR